jgi:hypothetical protein
MTAAYADSRGGKTKSRGGIYAASSAKAFRGLKRAEALSLPTSFSHLHESSFYVPQSAQKPGILVSAHHGALRREPSAQTRQKRPQMRLCLSERATYCCAATYIISLTHLPSLKMWVMTRRLRRFIVREPIGQLCVDSRSDTEAA